jgi:hypothetical protein
MLILWARGRRGGKVWEMNKTTYGAYLENLFIIDLRLDS